MAKPTGRSKTRWYDLEAVKAMGACGAIQQEMAGYFGVHVNTVNREYQDTEGEFRKAYDEGFSKLCVGLRRRQVQAAMKGNTAMMIWLGKQLLGQIERPNEGEASRRDYATELERALGALDTVIQPPPDEDKA